MNITEQHRLLSLGSVALGALVVGMVLASGLGLAPHAHAAKEPAVPVASAVPPGVSALPDFAALAERVTPSVVSVYTEEAGKSVDPRRFHQNLDPFEFFFGPGQGNPEGMRTPRRRGAGSGFFISNDGLILTNNHVVEDADKINVRVGDNSDLMTAKVVGRDPATDIALIRVEGKGPFPPPLALGDSDALRVGEWVMAVGNPLAMEHTVTVGVVSAKNRTLGLSSDRNALAFENFIQTDAAINLGNSGGPLVNIRGEVVGMNTAINAAGQNLGFAVPINAAKSVIPQLKEKGKVVRGYLNVVIRNVDQKTQEAFGLPAREGAFIESVTKGGPGEKAGLKEGDTIVAVGGVPVKETRQLIDRVSMTPPGQKLDLEVIRDGKRQNFTVVVGERPGSDEEKQSSTAKEDTPVSKLGLEVDDLSQRTRRQFEIPTNIEGILVTDVTDMSPADEAQLRPGDVIMRVNAQDVTSQRDFRDALAKIRSGALVRLYVFRAQLDQKSFVILRMP
ncbi:MAG: Do family serine endopeptidase [Thermoanaerobaculales bacterium]